MPSVSELLQRQGEQVADGYLRQGQIRANKYAQLAGIAGNAVQDIRQYQQDAPRRELAGLQLDDARAQATGRQAEAEIESRLRAAKTPDEILAAVGPERGAKIIAGLSAIDAAKTKQFADRSKVVADTLAGMDALPEPMRAEFYPQVRQTLLGAGVIGEQDAPETYDAKWFQQARNYGQDPSKAPEAKVVGASGALVGPDGKVLYQAPKEPEKVTFSKPEPYLVNGKRTPILMGSDGKPYTMGAKPIDPATVQEIPAAPTERAKFWVVRDGKPLRITEAQYQPGDLPSNTREQGRPVISGDANKLSDYDTSLDDADVLTAVVKEPGTLAKIQSWAPSWVTEITGGWGTDAKSQNAVISRVRQVIGKALEGGVLRKEDEVKYKDILPVIGDSKELVANKLTGLKVSLEKRKARLLDSLEDAGYEVGKFRARQTKIDTERKAGGADQPIPDFIWDPKTQTLKPNPKKGGG